MFVSDLAGLLGTAFCFAIAFGYIRACDARREAVVNENIILLLISAALRVYLVYAMLRPEKFKVITNGWLQIATFFLLVLLATKPLRLYMARVFEGRRTLLDPRLVSVEKLLCRMTRGCDTYNTAAVRAAWRAARECARSQSGTGCFNSQ
jgi:K+-transporting ATPase KdpF subunit